MDSTKPEIDLSEEELIALARQAKKVSIPLQDLRIYRESSYIPLNSFIKAIGLQPGKQKVRTLDIYNSFSKYYIEEVIPRRKFALELSKVFKKSSVHYYLLNLNKEEIEKQLERLQNVES